MTVAFGHPSHLIVGYLRNTLSPEEKRQLNEWVESSVSNKAFFDQITDPKYLKEALLEYGSANGDSIWDLIKKQVPELPNSYKDAES